jgi:hypothetical protein
VYERRSSSGAPLTVVLAIVATCVSKGTDELKSSMLTSARPSAWNACKAFHKASWPPGVVFVHCFAFADR